MKSLLIAIAIIFSTTSFTQELIKFKSPAQRAGVGFVVSMAGFATGKAMDGTAHKASANVAGAIGIVLLGYGASNSMGGTYDLTSGGVEYDEDDQSNEALLREFKHLDKMTQIQNESSYATPADSSLLITSKILECEECTNLERVNLLSDLFILSKNLPQSYDSDEIALEVRSYLGEDASEINISIGHNIWALRKNLEL